MGVFACMYSRPCVCGVDGLEGKLLIKVEFSHPGKNSLVVVWYP